MEENLLLHYYGICERHGNDALLGEPLNLISNIGFLITGVLIYRSYRNNPDLEGFKLYDIKALIFCIFAIFIGSSIFHLMPSRATEIIDMIPIVAFITIFFLSAMMRVTKFGIPQTTICFLAFAGSTHILVTLFPNAFNDSIGYLSSMTALICIALYLNIKRRYTARMFLTAAIIGVISLFFRSVDNAVCDYVPVGTHFMWHSCNAILIYILMMQLLRNINRRARMLRDASKHFA